MEILKLKGVVKDYLWGEKDFIPSLIGPTGKERNAEYWMGTHPEGEAECESGEKLSERLGYDLTFLFKIISIASPLSLQCHPNKKQAEAGWKKEEEKREKGEKCNYSDDNEKAELLVALTPTTALVGFDSFTSAMERLKKYVPSFLSLFEKEPKTIKELFLSLFNLDEEKRIEVLHELSITIKNDKSEEGPFLTRSGVIKEALVLYSGDIGSVVPLLMNEVHLLPGEGIYLEPDVIHAYSRGNGMEIMSASNNVLRAGMTKKNVDTKELSKIMSFDSLVPQKADKKDSNGLEEYLTPSSAFVLYRGEKGEYMREEKSDSILISLEDKVEIKSEEQNIVLNKGEVAFIPKGSTYSLYSSGLFFLSTGKV